MRTTRFPPRLAASRGGTTTTLAASVDTEEKMQTKIQNKQQSKRQKAFTLVEIVVVVSIIGVLLCIAVPSYLQAKKNADCEVCKAQLHAIQTAKMAWAAATKAEGSAEPTETDIGSYLEGPFPTCSSDGATYIIGAITNKPTCSHVNPEHKY